MMSKLQLSVTDGGTLHEFSLYYKERTCPYAGNKDTDQPEPCCPLTETMDTTEYIDKKRTP